MCIENIFKDQTKDDGLYYPPTYAVDGFIHATGDPRLLIEVANHFYKESEGFITLTCLI